MASYAMQGQRQWASSSRPEYNRLPVEEGEEDGTTDGSGSGSSPRQQYNDILSFQREKLQVGSSGIFSTVLALPILLVRATYLCWLLLIKPVRRGSRWTTICDDNQAWWLSVYGKLGAFRVLVPSFLQPPKPGRMPRRLHQTAWLDGLRGVSALVVVFTHATVLTYNWHVFYGWGSKPDEKWLIQLPFLRLIVSGQSSVVAFFVVSGYALSYKPLRLSRQGRFGEAFEAIGSATFRRWLRLFIMPAAVTLASALMAYFDLFGRSGWSGTAVPSRVPPRPGTLLGQLTNWATTTVFLMDPFSKNLKRGMNYEYDFFLWTLPVELDCSLVLFLCQAAFICLRPNARLLLMLGLTVYAMKYTYWQNFLFFMGMIICDVQLACDGIGSSLGFGLQRLLRIPDNDADKIIPTDNDAASAEQQTPSPAPPPRRRLAARYRTIAGVLVFVLCLYVLSMPMSIRGAAGTPGYRTMAKLVPEVFRQQKKEDYFWYPLGAALLVFVTDRTPLLQRLFIHPFSQYLGFVSYSMYLVHGPLLFTAGHWIVRQTTALTGTATQAQYGAGMVLAALLWGPLLVVVADLVTRTLDTWSVSLSKRLYDTLRAPTVNDTAAAADAGATRTS